ncbi:MAG: hypothetical protein ABJE95_34260 [Byssovorax sp.]
MRINVPALAISAIALPLLLVFACTPKVRPDPSGSGGAATGTTGSGLGGLGGLGGSIAEGVGGFGGGLGGSAPMGTCTKAGQTFTIFGDAELTGTPKLGDKLYLVPDAEKRAMVHVVLEDNGMNRVLVRTVIDDPSPLGNFAQYGSVGGPSFRLSGARAVPGELLLRGALNSSVAELAYIVDPDKGVGVDGAGKPLPTPVECTQGGHIGKVVFANGSDQPLYLVTCIPDDPLITTGVVYASNTSGALTQIAMKEQSAPELSPALYTYENGTHLVVYGGDKTSTFFSYGATADLLGALQPLKLTPNGATLEGVFAMVPLPADQGVTLIAAFFDSSVGKGKFLAGSILGKDYASLAKIPPGGIAPIQDIATLADVAPIFSPTWDPTSIYGGGASTDGATARLYWFTRGGKPRVFGQTIYASPGPTILTANAATLGTLNTLFVWTEEDDSIAPPKYTVKGQKLICQVKS